MVLLSQITDILQKLHKKGLVLQNTDLSNFIVDKKLRVKVKDSTFIKPALENQNIYTDCVSPKIFKHYESNVIQESFPLIELNLFEYDVKNLFICFDITTDLDLKYSDLYEQFVECLYRNDEVEMKQILILEYLKNKNNSILVYWHSLNPSK